MSGGARRDGHPTHEPVVRGWRRLALTGFALLLTLFLVETARHSVHHLDDEREAETCAVASVAGHVQAVGTTPDVVPLLVSPVFDVVVDPAPAARSLRPLDEHSGRAPPIRLSA